MSPHLTVVIPTLDEAARTEACIASVRWAGEIIVADGGSTDATLELARAVGATVLEHCGPTIAAQRNLAIARATHAWVLTLDADEVVSPELATELAIVVIAPGHGAYRVRRQNFYWAELTRGHWGHDWIVALLPLERRYLEQRVHEAPNRWPMSARSRERCCTSPIRPGASRLEDDAVSEWGAQDLFDQGRRASLSDLLAPAVVALRKNLDPPGQHPRRAVWRDQRGPQRIGGLLQVCPPLGSRTAAARAAREANRIGSHRIRPQLLLTYDFRR